MFYNYIIKCLQFQAFQIKFFARMFQIQLRYFQYILSFAIFVGVVISSKALITSCFVGLILVWLTEMLIGQFDIKSQQYIVVLTVLLLSFSSVAIQSINSNIDTVGLLLSCLLLSITYFLFQKDINIYKVGNVLVALFLSFLVNRFYCNRKFSKNIYYVSYLYLLLLFLKTLATYFAVQFSNFQFFFNFFIVSVVFIGVSGFYSFNTLYIFLAGLTTALFTTLITFMFVKNSLRVRIDSETF